MGSVTTDAGASPPKSLPFHEGLLLICGFPSRGGLQRHGYLSKFYLTGVPLRNSETLYLPEQSFWKDKSQVPLSSLYLPTSLGLEHLFIFLGLLLNMGLLTREKELIHLNHSSANHKADETHTGANHPTTQQQGQRVPPSHFSFNLFWHQLCDNIAGWPLQLSFTLMVFFSVLTAQRGVQATGLEPWI